MLINLEIILLIVLGGVLLDEIVRRVWRWVEKQRGEE